MGIYSVFIKIWGFTVYLFWQYHMMWSVHIQNIYRMQQTSLYYPARECCCTLSEDFMKNMIDMIWGMLDFKIK